MQAVILAAGKSTRTYPLTLEKPKPLLKAANKTILEHNLKAVKDIADEIIIVVGFKKDMIKEFIKNNYPKLKIKFIEQKEQLGTGNAVSILKEHIKDKFILLMGDNIHTKEDINKIAKHQYSILVKKVKNPEIFGVVIEENNLLRDIIEKPEKPASNLINCALYSLDKEIFNVLKIIKKSKRGEYELTDAIKELSRKNDIHCIKSTSWLEIGYPWDLLTADKELRGNKNIIGKNSKISGNVNNSSIGDNCTISGNVKNSIVMPRTIIDKNSIVEDSIIGENVYFKGTAKSSENTKSIIDGKEIIANRLGAIIGDNVKAEDVNIAPGCKIWPDKRIKGEINHDIV